MAKTLFNRCLSRGCYVVKNAFGILKQTFCELLNKFDLHIAFLLDVIVTCAILHNILLGQSFEQVEMLLYILRQEGLNGEVLDDIVGPPDVINVVLKHQMTSDGVDKCITLSVYLSTPRLYRQQ